MQCSWLCALPLEVLHENILSHLSVRDLQALNTAFTNKLHRLQLRVVWKSYRWVRTDCAIALGDLCWLYFVGVQVVGIQTWYAMHVLFVVSSASLWFPSLKQINDDSYCNIIDESLVELAHNCPRLEVLRLSFSSYYTDVGVTALAQHCRQLHTIALSSDNITDAAIQALCDNCPHLQHIFLICCEKLTDASLIAIANTYPHLQSIHSSNFTDDALIFCADKCRELRLMSAYCAKVTIRGLTALWTANPKLTDVELSCDDISDKDVKFLVQNCHELENISLKWCYELSDIAVNAVAKHCPQLTSLNINDCRHISDASLIALGQHCHKLKSIDITRLGNITDVGTAALAAGCPLLQEFYARGTNITDVAVCELAELCSELCKIDLSCCQSISSDAVAAIAENCLLLSVLDISFCGNLHSDCLYTIAQHCRNLTKLNFMSNNDLEAEALLTLIASCKQLRDLRCGERYLEALRCYSTSVFVH